MRPLSQARSLAKAAAGLVLAAGMTIAAPAAFAAEAMQRSIVKAASVKQSTSPEQTVSQPLANGVYLYGQSAEAEQLGSAYLVFEVRDRQVTGAFYMPHSSFDCFNGAIESNRLALNVIDSYEQAAYPYEIGLEQSDAVATVGNTTITPVQIEGFHRIDSVSENDQRILASCQAIQ
ncbi:MAG: hypothetical protein HC895_21190 [Leptolyngbyaceae cyanobacterium SM1_3_5]|nr:hypothetical protein [Leptolyngbyaceae cyanobacterium SM1_3_5]